MSHVKTKTEGFPRKNVAQDRLNRLRDELKLKRRIEDQWEKFKHEQSSTKHPRTAEVFVNKYRSDTNQVNPREIRTSEGVTSTKHPRAAEVLINKYRSDTNQVNPRETKISEGVKRSDKPKTSVKKTPPLKTRVLSHNVESWNAGDSKKLSKSAKKRARARKSNSFNEDPIASSSLSNPSTDVRTSSQPKYVKHKCGIADERLEKARKSLLKYKVEAVTSVDAPVVNSSKVESVTSTSTPPVANYVEDMDVDMDVDMSEPPACSEAVVSVPSKLPDKWFKQEDRKTSFFVDAVRSTREDSAYLAQLEECIPDVEMPLSVPSGDLLIILDTNIFLSHLKFLDRLLKSTIGNYKSHVLVVPWVVIQEIDHNMKKPDRELASAARSANHFIADNLERPNFFGQSLDEFKLNFKNAVSADDFLLQYGLKLVALRNNVVLISDDKNLCNKCMFCHLPVYTKNDFEKTFDIRATQ